MMQVSDINEYLVTQAPESVNELLKCLRDKTDCICLKTAHYPSWSGGNQKIVVCTQNCSLCSDTQSTTSAPATSADDSRGA